MPFTNHPAARRKSYLHDPCGSQGTARFNRKCQMTYWGYRDARFSGCDTALCHMKRQHENVRTLNAGQAMPRAEYLVDL